MMRRVAIALLIVGAVAGLSREASAQAGFTMYCGTSPATAIPCGTSTTPLVTNPTGAPTPLTALGYQQITSLGTAASLTVPAGSKVAVISVETASVRWRDDGTAPTASVGMPIAAGTGMVYAGPLAAIQFIAQSGSPVVDVSYFK